VVRKKTLILSLAIAVVVTVPAAAWAVGGPFGADPQPTTITGNADPGAPYGWMGQMHDHMWGNGELPEDSPADAAHWMNQMHDYMWGGSRSSTQVDPRSQNSGASIFQLRCLGCHGPGGEGLVGPSLVTSVIPIAAVLSQIASGGSTMPAFGEVLTASEINAVVSFVIGLRPNQSVPFGSNSQAAGSTQPDPGPGWGGCGMWGGR
jgi:mono/diheme cytochrome c family protein